MPYTHISRSFYNTFAKVDTHKLTHSHRLLSNGFRLNKRFAAAHFHCIANYTCVLCQFCNWANVNNAVIEVISVSLYKHSGCYVYVEYSSVGFDASLILYTYMFIFKYYIPRVHVLFIYIVQACRRMYAATLYALQFH